MPKFTVTPFSAGQGTITCKVWCQDTVKRFGAKVMLQGSVQHRLLKVWCQGTVTKQCTNTSYTLYAPRQATHACYKQADKLQTVTRQVTKTSYT